MIGRLTRDPEIRYSQGATPTAVAKFSIAVDRRFKRDGEQSADFINCVAFGKTAEFFEKYGRKGKKFGIEGRWQTNSYTNKDGQKVYTNDCVVEHCEFAEGKNADQGLGNSQQQSRPAAGQDDFMSIPPGIDEDMPFS